MENKINNKNFNEIQSHFIQELIALKNPEYITHLGGYQENQFYQTDAGFEFATHNGGGLTEYEDGFYGFKNKYKEYLEIGENK